MSKLKLDHKIYLLAAFLVLITAAAVFFYIYPNIQQIGALKNEIYDSRLQLAVYDQQKSNQEQTRLDYNKIKNDISDMAQIFIKKEKILDLISSLESIATQNNIEQDINLNSKAQTDNANNMPLQLNLSGGWPEIMNYLGQIEKQNYYLSIYDFSFSENGNNILLTAQANVFPQ